MALKSIESTQKTADTESVYIGQTVHSSSDSQNKQSQKSHDEANRQDVSQTYVKCVYSSSESDCSDCESLLSIKDGEMYVCDQHEQLLKQAGNTPLTTAVVAQHTLQGESRDVIDQNSGRAHTTLKGNKNENHHVQQPIHDESFQSFESEMNSIVIQDNDGRELEYEATVTGPAPRLLWSLKGNPDQEWSTPTSYGGLEKIKAHQATDIVKKYGIDFQRVREICEKNGDLSNIDTHPCAYSQYRQDFWPYWTLDGHDDLAYTYSVVREHGLPNTLGERLEIHSELNVQKWEEMLPEKEFKEIIDGLKFGYSLGYIGPISFHNYNRNHKSAEDYPEHVNKYIEKEIQQGTLLGPFEKIPFEFSHTSPLMSREKSSSDKRRIISDLKFPPEASINAYIPKNTLYGKTRVHQLPKSDDVVAALDLEYKEYYLYTLDIANAYKNFIICPNEWPLLTFKWGGQYFIENRLPFGSKNSSLIMQSIANAIIHILKKNNIQALMYLDDLLVISKGWEKAKNDVEIVTKIFRDLNLPTVPEKAQGPQKAVIWLGVVFDTSDFTISVPEEKLDKVIQNIEQLYMLETITLKQMQSIIGKIVHISKCIIPSRIFTSRILAAQRSQVNGMIKITHQVRQDFLWFLRFAKNWNGCAKMNNRKYLRTIYTHCAMPFIMASDGQSFFICNTQRTFTNINYFQASVLNIAIAIDIFSQQSDTDGQTQVITTSKKTAIAYNVGNTRNPSMDHVVREKWYQYALSNRDYKIVFNESPQPVFCELSMCARGIDPQIAINQVAQNNNLVQVYPPHDFYTQYVNDILYRSTDADMDATRNR